MGNPLRKQAQPLPNVGVKQTILATIINELRGDNMIVVTTDWGSREFAHKEDQHHLFIRDHYFRPNRTARWRRANKKEAIEREIPANITDIELVATETGTGNKMAYRLRPESYVSVPTVDDADFECTAEDVVVLDDRLDSFPLDDLSGRIGDIPYAREVDVHDLGWSLARAIVCSWETLPRSVELADFDTPAKEVTLRLAIPDVIIVLQFVSGDNVVIAKRKTLRAPVNVDRLITRLRQELAVREIDGRPINIVNVSAKLPGTDEADDRFFHARIPYLYGAASAWVRAFAKHHIEGIGPLPRSAPPPDVTRHLLQFRGRLFRAYSETQYQSCRNAILKRLASVTTQHHRQR